MTTEDHTPHDFAAPSNARGRLGKLSQLSPIRQVLPSSVTALALTIAVGLAIVIFAALALGTPASDMFDAYVSRWRDVK